MSSSRDPLIDDIKSKIEKRVNPVQYYVKFSFTITYIFLLTTTIITFIESLRTPVPSVRHILNIETSVSIIAGYFYSKFIEKIASYERDDVKIDWADISLTRYIDWSMTTPLMLLILCLVLSQNIGKSVTLSIYSLLVFLNFSMLYVGYLGENNTIDKYIACFLGFIPFVILFYIIFKNFVSPVYNFSNYVIFSAFVTIWSLYGLFFLMNDTYKNIGNNILDCLAKCGLGLGLWAYFSKVITLK